MKAQQNKALTLAHLESYFSCSQNPEKLNIGYLNEEICLYISNEKPIYNMLMNKRIKAHSVVWSAFLHTANVALRYHPGNYVASSAHLKAFLAKYGLDYNALQESIDFVENKRKEILN